MRDLTIAQQHIAVLIAQGLTRAEVAEVRGIALTTVNTHLKWIDLKLPGEGSLRRRIVAWVRTRT